MNKKRLAVTLVLVITPGLLLAARPSINELNTRVNQLEAENNAQQSQLDDLDVRVTDLETGDIKGIITVCNQAEADILIYAPGTSFSAVTDGGGNFKLSYVQQGTYNLVVKKSGAPIGTVSQITVVKKQTVDIGTNDYCNLNIGENCSSDSQCASGYCINGICSDLSSDPNNCGAIGNACLSLEACISGVCVDDPDNCGALGNACLSNEICISGTCITP